MHFKSTFFEDYQIGDKRITLGRTITATAAFEWPTIEAMSGHLDELLGGADAALAGASAGARTAREELSL